MTECAWTEESCENGGNRLGEPTKTSRDVESWLERPGISSRSSRFSRLSIVIATHNAAHVITPCLAALQAQCDPGLDEIVVADSSSDGTADIVREHFPDIRLLHFKEPLTIPELRGKAIAVARGEIIALLDPFSIVEEHWLQEMLKAHRERPDLVIGGAVELYNAESESLVAWATYINEYGMFMPPLEAGEVNMLPGSNISYKRAALFDGQHPRQVVFWKTFVNWGVRRAGSPLWLAPSSVVRLWKPIPFWDFFRTRYDHARCFAGMRTAKASLAERLLRAGSAPLLPALLLWRWGSAYWAKRRHRDKLLLTLPMQLLLFSSWAWGELVGYLCGTGRSCRRLFY